MVGLSAAQRSILIGALKLAVFGVTLQSVLQDPSFEPPVRDLDVAEIFTTAQSVALAAKAAGFNSAAYDIKIDGCSDACELTGFKQLLQLVMRLKPGGLLCVAPCCKTFIFAPRRWTCRNAQNVQGDTSRPVVRAGNLMARIAMFIYCVALLRGVEAVLENPAGSMIFRPAWLVV